MSFAHPKPCTAGDRLLGNQDLRTVQRQQLLGDLNCKKADREGWKGKHGKDRYLKVAHYRSMTQDADSFLRNVDPGFFYLHELGISSSQV